MKNLTASLKFSKVGPANPLTAAIDAHAMIAYTDDSDAAQPGRSSLPSSFSESEQAKGRLESDPGNFCFPRKTT